MTYPLPSSLSTRRWATWSWPWHDTDSICSEPSARLMSASATVARRRPDRTSSTCVRSECGRTRAYFSREQERIPTRTMQHCCTTHFSSSFVVIGEAVKHLAQDTRSSAPEIPWADIASLRDLIAHEYFRIDIDRMLEIVARDLSPLEQAIDRLLSS